jgi:hypothetical protein
MLEKQPLSFDSNPARFYGAISKDKPLFLTIRGLPKFPPINELKAGRIAPPRIPVRSARSEATLVRPAEEQPPRPWRWAM